MEKNSWALLFVLISLSFVFSSASDSGTNLVFAPPLALILCLIFYCIDVNFGMSG